MPAAASSTMPSASAICRSFVCGQAVFDAFGHRRRHDHDFVNRNTARVAGAEALLAAAAAVEHGVSRAACGLCTASCSSDSFGSTGSLHSRQICRSNRWAIEPNSAPPILKLSTPKSFEPGDGADRVVGVQRADQQVAGEGRLHARSTAVSWSRISPTMITSGSCRMMYFKCVGKAQAVLVVRRHLVDAGQAVFDRVFDRHDVAADRVELRQQRVHRRRSCRSRSGR